MDRLDKTVALAALLLLLAMGVVVLAGDNVGVQIANFSPEGQGRGRQTVRVRFYEPMDQASVEERFSIEPAIEGTLRWNGARELVFEPALDLVSGQRYTVRIGAGALAAEGSPRLREDFHFSFQAAAPRVLYLAPANLSASNLYAYDLNTNAETQLTFSEFGVLDYAVSADGGFIAYSQANGDGTSDLWLYDVSTKAQRQITDCVSAICLGPAWHPDGTQIAYEREEVDQALGVSGARRVWVVDLASARSTLLFEDTQIVGHSPKFSPDGQRVAIFNVDFPGIMVYDYESQGRTFIQSMQGVVGAFSPEGSRLVYPILVRGAIGQSFYNHLEMVDLESNERYLITGDAESPIDDKMAVWHPDGEHLAISRRYFDERYTPTPQVYLLNLESREVTPLFTDTDYVHSSLVWSRDGQWLLMHRFNETMPEALPEIWAYSMQTERLQQISDNAFLPGVLP